ncbi:hypothetical protein DLNHIDIE_01772 [Acidithiobacillus thiooxidans ATCC 19377]|uniref:Uncharacterized protein n=3 Tax=Acidithiobacillus thiooxidans TaxID=930 RepID=A0A543Q6D9_ACITH|nr:cache domain-containing protein [Acidithiobacillus albertensis]TQN51891.1 hypothetical protein DLNHIDIE_01772 [Acidithiobacillus thiooxidans ATCC 19377]
MDTINEEVRSEMEQIAANKLITRDHISSVVTRQRERLMQLLYAPMQRITALISQIAHTSEQPLGDRSSLDALLKEVFSSVPYAKYLYIMNRDGVQFSSSMSCEGLIAEHCGRDRSDRPYMREALSVANYLDRSRETCYQQWPYLGDHTQAVDFLLCEAYISQNALRPSMTATYFLRDPKGTHIGFLGADFALRDLPPIEGLYENRRRSWHFSPATQRDQVRQASRLDREINTVISVLEELITFRGVYHVKIHFSSSQTVLWQMNDPYQYRILGVTDLLDPDSCLAYPNCPYPEQVAIRPKDIRFVLERMEALRRSDNPIYLRSFSLNIFNGLVGTSFLSDDSYYIPYDDFLKSDCFG